jgi:class 3 adenylate cyclase
MASSLLVSAIVMPDSNKQRDELEAAISGLEAQRASLGESVVEPALAALRKQLAHLDSSPSKSDVDEERKLVTIVFADIAGFTALSETKDAEEVRALMNACFDRLVPVITKYDGTIDKFIGDEIMALFGAPLAHEDDAERALRASLEMMAAIAAFNRTHGTNLDLHIGINTGPVVAGKIGEIFVGPATYRQTSRLFEFAPARPLELKGKAAPVEVRALLGVKAAPERTRGIEGLHAALMGRDAELQAVREALTALADGQGGILAVIGEAGLGKSRLIAEMKRLSPSNVRWAEARALPFTVGMSYWLAREFLCNLLGVDGNASPGDLGKVLRDYQARLFPGSCDIGVFLSRILDLPLDAETSERLRLLGPETLQKLMLDAVSKFVAANAADVPLILIWEDLHWCDPSSVEVLSAILPLSVCHQLLVVCVSRPEENRALKMLAAAADKYPAGFHRIELSPLDREQSESLINDLLKIRDLPQSLSKAILDRAEGNPFFLEELIRSLIDAGVIVIDQNGASAVGDTQTVEIPDTIQAVLAARIDRLQPAHKQTLQNASVIGRVFEEILLKQLAKEKESTETIDSSLKELLRREFILHDRAAENGPGDYAFKHAITHSVAYNSLLLARRAELHCAVGDAMEKLFTDRADELAAALAFHYERGRAAEKAFHYFTIAAERAEATYANAEAEAFYRSALTQLDRLKDAPRPDQEHSPSSLNEHLGDVLELEGEHGAARQAFDAGLAASDPTDRVQRARFLRKIGFSHSMQRQFAETGRFFEDAEEQLGNEAIKPIELWWQEKLQIQLDKMFLLYWQGEAGKMRELANRYRSAIEQYATPTQYGKFFQLLALSLLTGARYQPSAECIELAKKAVSQSRGRANFLDQAHFRFVLGLVNFFGRNFEAAAENCTVALQMAERCGDLVLQARCLTYLGAAYRCLGDAAKAQDCASEAKALATRLNMIEYIAMADANLSWVAWARGDFADAKRVATEALRSWHSMEEPYGFDWMALWPLVAVSLAEHRLTDAIEHTGALFAANQHPLPSDLAEAARRAIESAKDKDHEALQTNLRAALAKAEELGQLRTPVKAWKVIPSAGP